MTTIFIAGATGVVGTQLIPLLGKHGWRVIGLTRNRHKASLLTDLGAEPVVADVFDLNGLTQAMAAARPDVVIHQLTDLPDGLPPEKMYAATIANARMRDEGTKNLLAAALSSGVGRMVAQSVAFAYAEGPLPHTEGDPLAIEAPGRAGISARGVASLERQVAAAPLTGIVLRYGQLFGEGTGSDRPDGGGSLHVKGAAVAAALAVIKGQSGAYNIADDDLTVNCTKARRLLGWSPNVTF